MVESAIALTAILAGSSVISSTTGPASVPPPPVSGPLEIFWTYSPPFSIIGWAVVGLATFQGRGKRQNRFRKAFVQQGFSADIYNLMMGMRGGSSRLALLRTLEAPRHRNELSEMTGIDWKEVDRQVGVMENYGLVKVYAESGTVKLFQITEQGRLLLKFVDELDGTR